MNFINYYSVLAQPHHTVPAPSPQYNLTTHTLPSWPSLHTPYPHLLSHHDIHLTPYPLLRLTPFTPFTSHAFALHPLRLTPVPSPSPHTPYPPLCLTPLTLPFTAYNPHLYLTPDSLPFTSHPPLHFTPCTLPFASHPIPSLHFTPCTLPFTSHPIPSPSHHTWYPPLQPVSSPLPRTLPFTPYPPLYPVPSPLPRILPFTPYPPIYMTVYYLGCGSLIMRGCSQLHVIHFSFPLWRIPLCLPVKII